MTREKQSSPLYDGFYNEEVRPSPVVQAVEEALDNDLNTPLALATIFSFADKITSAKEAEDLRAAAGLLGLLHGKGRILSFSSNLHLVEPPKVDEQWLQQKISAREQARKVGDFALADKIRAELEKKNITVEDKKINQ